MTESYNKQLTADTELVRRYGGPISHAALDPSCQRFRVPNIDGLICFLLTYRSAVVLGDPICAPEHKAALADAFAAHCADHRRSVVYAAVTAAMQTYARERSYGTMEFASLLIANPQCDPEAGHQGHHLRQHLNHTRRMGVTVREYRGATAPDALLEAQTQAACDQWLSARQGPQMYLGRPRLFDDRSGRRWFIAEQAGLVVGMLSMLRVSYVDSGNLINIVFSAPTAPLYTNELLVVTALQALREEGAGSVCLGIGPNAALGQIDGCGSVTEFLSRHFYRLAANIMNLHGRTVFWEKYQITRREPLYLLFQSPTIGFREINALLRAFHLSMG